MTGLSQADWQAFRDEFAAHAGALIHEFTASWDVLQELLGEVEEAFAWGRSQEPPRGTLSSLQEHFSESGRRLLFAPLDRFRRTRPLQRALSALVDHDSALDDLARRLPAELILSGRELVELTATPAPWWDPWRRWRWSRGPIALRSLARDHFQRQTLARARLDGVAQLALARGCLHLLSPWQILRRQVLRDLRGDARAASALGAEWRSWKDTAARNAGSAGRILSLYRNWATKAGQRLALLPLRLPAEPSVRVLRRREEMHRRHLSHWSRQLRAVHAVLDLEHQFSLLACDLAHEAAGGLASLQNEHDELLAELDSAIQWLRDWPGVAAPDAFPPPGVRLLSTEERAAQQQAKIAWHARSRLPAAAETVEPRRALPGWRSPWCGLQPARLFIGILDAAPPVAGEALREAEASHRAIVREIERAREVVAYGLETARDEAGCEGSLIRESVHNALSLLQHQRAAAREVRSTVEGGAVRDLAGLLLESHLAFEKGRLGLLAHLAQQRGTQAMRQGWGLLLGGLRDAARRTVRAGRQAVQWTLLKTGWLTPPRARLEPVSRRARLGEVFDLESWDRDLPAIYRRLFRLAPVEEARFLVGREAELEGLAEACQRWRLGRPASVMVVGARGSGKTSLLNCAVSSLFQGAAVLRGQFSERITGREHLRQFLRVLLDAPDDGDPAARLAASRRIVVIEEFERLYLRVMGGFEALREFLDIIHSSTGSTLWVLSVNETAFRYLDAVAGLSRFFSHRVNAMSVTQPVLTKAILQRHNLSGLRLEFAPLPPEDPRLSKARRFLGLEQDAQQLFFDALFQQSEGLFRAAFELWQECIERVETGVVHMRQPLVPNYRRLYAELTCDDHFTLKAVLQHGSLTVAEHAQVMCATPEESQRRLERLESLEILEPEPSCPGWRVRPEAGCFARDTLHRQNLL